ncbi:branched-chain amino acid ABC transporter substrate-binding protein [Microvirga pudoricolor]|uniref:branched-chain amino acid ABC transporter substrate-binding protein n=1 Tax=Microvirga pudoricolor TaxID=2778729 RepID=UPI00194FC9DC|nr:branched-chain amino acid ABC transporter substrate-binding protein [Microvirga pudoricolor]MBM6596304.1 branched-chain amino acid ABC transporter substrate-binding protein [Microvirga pudoricolor]
MSPNPDQRPVVKVGFQLPEPNVHDVTGWCAAELAIDEFNGSANATVKVELVPIIDKRNREIAISAAETFANDLSAVGVLGPINSDMALTTQHVYNEAGLAQVTSEASSPSLTAKGYKNFRRVVANDEVQGRQLAKAAVSYLKAERIAVLSDGSGWGRPIAEIFSTEATRLGSKPVLEFFFASKEMNLDFDELIEAVVAAEPDLVYFAVYWNKAHIITHRLRDRGIKAVFLGSDALKPYAFLEVPSLDVIPPHHSLAGIDMRLQASARTFFEKFATRYPMMLVAPQYAAEAYDATGILLQAIATSSQPDRESVLKAVQAMKSYDGALGRVTFDENGDLDNPAIGLYRCKDGLRNYLGAIGDLT